MTNDILSDTVDSFEKLPGEIIQNAFEQIKGGTKHDPNQTKSDNAGTNLTQANDQNQQQWLKDLYGTSQLTPEQIKLKEEQDNKIKAQNYQKIQQDLAQYRAKKQQEVSKYDAAQQEGTKAVTTQDEKMELWQEQQKKAEEKKKEQERITMAGSAQSKSGEQGVVMG